MLVNNETRDPDRIRSLARATTLHAQCAAYVLLCPSDLLWDVLETDPVLDDLARAAARHPGAATDVLCRAAARAWRVLTPDHIRDLARAAAQKPQTAAGALIEAHACAWETIERTSNLVHDLAHAAVQDSTAAAETLTKARPCIWNILASTPDLIQDLARAAAQNPQAAAKTLKGAHPRAWEALAHASDCIRSLAQSAVRAPKATKRALVGMPLERWNALERDVQRILAMTALQEMDDATPIAERISVIAPDALADMMPVLSDQMLQSVLRAIPDEILADNALRAALCERAARSADVRDAILMRLNPYSALTPYVGTRRRASR
jgi:hypothetical protein